MKQTLPRVLLIDDEPIIAELIGESLKTESIDLVIAADGAAGLEIAREQHLDLVLLDLGLPGMTGFEVLQTLKQDARLAAVPVIVITGWDSTTDKVRAFEAGASDYVTKPFQITELVARVRAILRAVRAEAATQAKSSFLAMVGHEIRTPMGGVMGAVQLLRETSLDEQQSRLVETVHRSGQALLTLLDDLLDLSKIEAGRMELEEKSYRLRSQIEEVLDLLAPKAAEKNLDLVCFLEDQVPAAVLGDQARLRQVLLNLVGNAVKFTLRGEVVVKVAVPDAAHPIGDPVILAGNGSNPGHGWLHFTVRDTGPGIEPEKMAKLFKPFSQGDITTSRQHGGSGLGLAISRSLVELMGGTMWAESVPGEGATFHFCLPAQIPPRCGQCEQPGCHTAESQAWDESMGLSEADMAILQGSRLLLVEDGNANRDLILHLASSWGLTVQAATSGHQALEYLRGSTQYHVALLDRHLPENDGLWLAAEIRKLPQRQSMPVILLTTVQQVNHLPPAAAAGFAGYATKPILPARLRKALALAIRGHSTPTAAASLSARLDASLHRRYPLRILVVEDDEVNQEITLMLLRQLGYAAKAVANGPAALAALERESFDLLFLDIQLPGLDGTRVAAIIRQKEKSASTAMTPPVTIIAITALAATGERERILAAGMNDYLAKPIDGLDLQKLIEKWGRWIAQLRPLSSGIQRGSETLVATLAGQGMTPPDGQESPDVGTVDIMDGRRLLELASGDALDAGRILRLYLQQTAVHVDLLKEAWCRQDTDETKRLAHSGSGSSATCGMRRIAKVFQKIERLAKAGDLSSVQPLLEVLGHELDQVGQESAKQTGLKVPKP